MKKLRLIIFLFFCPALSYAYDCSNPNQQYTVLLGILGTYTCGYTNGTPGTLCYEAAHGNAAASGAMGCKSLVQAPINEGLIFLIIGGIALGSYSIMKKQKSQPEFNQ